MACAGSVSTGTKGRTSADRTRRTSSRERSIATAQRPHRWSRNGARITATAPPIGCAKSASGPKRAERRGNTTAVPGAFDADVAALEAADTPRAIRFKVPAGTTAFDDVVHGQIEFDGAHIEDFVILRSDGHPTYHLSVVVDDIDMAITHVVRGDDHISNTPKHVLLFQALGAPLPVFAHVPLILGADKKRLSKRHGATSVMEYERQGYLPEAMVNFLALLGWSPGDDRELMSRDELVERASRSKASAAATPCSTRRSSIG